jgi:hypothetical protein
MTGRTSTPKINLLKLPKMMGKKPTLLQPGHRKTGSFVPGKLDGNLMQSTDFANTQAFASVREGTKPFNYE